MSAVIIKKERERRRKMRNVSNTPPMEGTSGFGKRNTWLVGLLAICWLCFGAFELLAALTEQSFLAPESWTQEFTYSHGWRPEYHPRLLADVNGDNHKD